jgi:hypothetical protein
MRRFLLALSVLLLLAPLPALAQNAITLPIAANAVADLGNGPIKVRMIAGNASIFTAQGSGTGSTSGASTTLTLTATPATPPIVGGLISGNGITSGTTVTAYNGTTGMTLSAAMTVPGGTTVSWGAACPSSVGSAPVIQASPMAGYYIMYTQARVCAVSPGGPVNTLLVDPVFNEVSIAGLSVGGVVFGPATSNVGDVAVFSNITGNGLIDPGYAPRVVLTVNTTFYANNNGASANCNGQTCQAGTDVAGCGLSLASPCSSLGFAMAQISQRYDLVAYTVGLQVADGTYNECLLPPDYVANYSVNQIVTINGNSTMPTNVIINCTSEGTIIARNIASRWGISNLEVESVGGNHQCVVANSANFYVETGTTFGACNLAMQGENAGGIVTLQGTLQVVATAASEKLLSVNNGGEIAGNGAVVINGSASLTYGYSAAVSSTGFIDLTGMAFTGFSGVTATKYLYSDYTGYINSASDPDTILPGSVNGTPIMTGTGALVGQQQPSLTDPTITAHTYAGLPSSPSDGQISHIIDALAANCTDGACTTPGTAVTGGGGIIDILIRWDSVNSAWRVLGANGIPNINKLNGAPAGAVVGTTDTQTLTNKSISGAEINSGTVAVGVGGTGNTTATAHSIPVSEGTSAQNAVGPCATNQVIVGGGAGADPGCGLNVAGSLVNLATLTASNSASLSDTTHITGTYSSYVLVFQNILPASNERVIEFQVHSGGSFQTSGYDAVNILAANSSVGSSDSNSTAYIPLTHVTAGTNQSISNSAPGYSGTITLTNPSANSITSINGEFGYFGGGGAGWQVRGSFFGAWATAGVVDGFQVKMDDGSNIASGSIIIYGRL